MDKVNEYVEVKMMLGIISLVFGMLALAFAIFGWSQTVQPLFGIYIRYVCIFGSSGAIISGTLMINENLAVRKPSLLHRTIRD
jgi:hypothetical protein